MNVVVCCQAEVAAAHDFMESYELVCFAVMDPEAGANEVIAGAVHGGEPLPLVAVPNWY